MDILLFLITKTKYKCGFYSSNIDIIHITFPIEELCSYVARSDRFFFFKDFNYFCLVSLKVQCHCSTINERESSFEMQLPTLKRDITTTIFFGKHHQNI